jgi:predicted phosphodiesterase
MIATLGNAPRRVLLLGDTHGSERWIARAARVAADMGLDGIVQLGDFGYLPDDHWHQRFLGVAEELLAEAGVPLWFLRGNHDDSDAIERLTSSGRDDEFGAFRISPHIRYLPCGTRWTWGSSRLGVLGGAFSVDRHELVEGSTWWPGELVDPAAVTRLGTEPLDVLFTHEAPLSSPTIIDRYVPTRGHVDHMCTSQRRLVDHAARATRASAVVHGHHHVRYDEISGSTRIVGLACESWDALAVFDTATASVSALCSTAMRRAAAACDDSMLRGSQYAERQLTNVQAS